MRDTIANISRLTDVPAGTIRRWVSEGRLTTVGDHKPHLVDDEEVTQLRHLLARRARPGVG